MKVATIMQPNDVKRLVSLHARLSEIVESLAENGAKPRRRRKARKPKATAKKAEPKLKKKAGLLAVPE